MKSLIEKCLNKIPSEYGEIHIEKKNLLSLQLSNGHVESISKKEILQGNIRILHKGYWGFVSFNSLDDLDPYLRIAIKNSEDMAVFSKQKRRIKSHPRIKKEYVSKFKIDPLKIPLHEKYKTLIHYDKILQGFKKIVNRKLNYIERKEEIYYGNTEGSLVSQEKIFTGFSGSAIAKEGDNIQMGRDSWGGYIGYEIIPNHEEGIEHIGKNAEALLQAKMVNSGHYDVVLDPRLAGVFAHEAFGHLSEADFVYENKELMDIMQLGKKFGIENLNIIDEGNIEGESGNIYLDDEGVLPQKTYLIKEGILHSRLHSRETASTMKEELTGNARAIDPSFQPIVRMTNTYIDKGNHTFEEIIHSIENGIYAVDYIGGQTNLEMFTFSAGRAYHIQNGKIKDMYKNVVLTGNVFKTLFDIEMIGNDLVLFGGLGGCGKGGQSPLPVSTGGPHIKIKNILIGGV